MASLIRPTQEQLKVTIDYLNYNGPVFSSVRSTIKEDDNSILKIISRSAY